MKITHGIQVLLNTCSEEIITYTSKAERSFKKKKKAGENHRKNIIKNTEEKVLSQFSSYLTQKR